MTRAILSKAHKNLHKLSFYSRHALGLALPTAWRRRQRQALIADVASLPDERASAIQARVNYYNKLSGHFELSPDAIRADSFRRDKSWAYYLDMLTLLRAFPAHCRFHYLFGDITHTPSVPTFVKSRPVGESNTNAVLLKLNRIRHYYFVKDTLPFDDKQDRIVWRGACHQPHRQSFIQAFYASPLCDVGDVHRNAQGKPWYRPFLSVREQLRYKFVLSIEGNDVATNLKWIMASNSLCFMTRPRYETWFMEGALVPGVHYVELKTDYSDLEDKVSYYSRHPFDAKQIIRNANRHVAQFTDEAQEQLIGLLVMQKYFMASNQLSGVPAYP